MTSDSRRGSARSAFAGELRQHMERWSGYKHPDPPYWLHWTDGVYQPYRISAREMVKADSVSLHEYARHLLSSQVFAFNLFLPFRQGDRQHLSETISEFIEEEILIDRVAFEWVPPGHLLCEIDGEWPALEERATAVDIVLWCRLNNGRRGAVLLEVKPTEDKFTHCNGRKSKGNRRQDVCQSAQLFFDNPGDCYLTRPYRKSRGRRYWEIFAGSYGGLRQAFPHADLSGGCPFAYNMQQPMRNLAVARALEQEDLVQRAWYGLCAHDRNPDVSGHWSAWQELLGQTTPAPLIPASRVVGAGEEAGLTKWASYMRSRYRL